MRKILDIGWNNVVINADVPYNTEPHPALTFVYCQVPTSFTVSVCGEIMQTRTIMTPCGLLEKTPWTTALHLYCRLSDVFWHEIQLS